MASKRRGSPPAMAEMQKEYTFVREIGRGGTGVVYLATDRELGRTVAIKLIQSSLVADEETLQRFTREARTAALLHHPNIVAVHAVKRLRKSGLAMVLQYVPGGTLKDLIRRAAPLPVEIAERVLFDIASALAYAHARGIVHRDVKPENIFIDETTGAALLADFGIARTSEACDERVVPGVAIGTPAYMSPEQIEGGEVDGRADLYSLALVGWEMLTGEAPWEGDSLFNIIHKQKFESLPALQEFRDDVPFPLLNAISVSLQKDPGLRYPDADSFIAALDDAGSRKPWGRLKRLLAMRRLRNAAAAPAPPLPQVSLAAVEPIVLPADGNTDATVRFVRPPAAAPEDAAPVAPAAELPEPRSGTDAATADLALPAPESQPVPRGRFPSWRATASTLRFAAAAGGLLLLTGLGATVYGITQQGSALAPLAGASTAQAASEAATPEAQGDPGRFGFVDSTAPFGEEAAPGPEGELAPDSLQNAADGSPPAARDSTPAPADARADVAATPQPAPDSAAPPVTRAEAPAPVAEPRRTRTIAVGGVHTCLVNSAGEAYCWGGNSEGQAGGGEGSRVASAATVGRGLQFRSIAAGVSHTCGILANGQTVCWGSNRSGQLGDGGTSGRPEPTPVRGGQRFASVHASRSHTCGLTSQGALFCWGDNTFGQLGNGGTGSSTAPVRSGSGTYAAVALGWSHTCAVDRRGQASCWGSNADGQLGSDNTSDSATPVVVSGAERVSQLVAGAAHTCALTAGGTVHCWGRNANGQLGDGSTTPRRAPARVNAETSFASLSAGSTHTCGLTRGGEVYCWGRNNFGQLGDGSTADRLVPTRVAAQVRFASIHASGAHTCGLTPGGEQFCWGYNVEGQLGDGTRVHRSRPVRIAAAAG